MYDEKTIGMDILAAFKNGDRNDENYQNNESMFHKNKKMEPVQMNITKVMPIEKIWAGKATFNKRK